MSWNLGSNVSVMLIVTSLVVSTTLAADISIHQATESAQELRMMLLRSFEQVESMHIKYRAQSQIDNTTGKYIVREIITKQPYLVCHFGAHGSALTSWVDDPNQQKASIQANRYFNEFSLNRIYSYGELDPNGPLPGTLQSENWFQLTGVWPLSARRSPRVFGLVPMLKELARSDDYSIVNSQLEVISGFWCHVLRRADGGDRLWLDAARNCALMKREVDAPGSGRLFCRVDLREQSEVLKGLWLPKSIRFRQYSWEQGHERITSDFMTHVTHISVNDVPCSEFEFHPRPGSLSFDEKSPGDARQTEVGGLDHLNSVYNWMIRVYGAPAGYAKTELRKECLILVSTVAVIIVLEYRRRRWARAIS